MNQAYSAAVAQGISWINGQMLTFDGGTYGIYERIRIDEHLRTCWVRPDCNTEYLRVLQMQKKRTGSDEFDSLAEKILRWLIKTQDTSPTSIWKGAFPFYVIDGTIRGLANSEAVYQNDNGKILNALCQMYENNPDPRFLAIARPLADYWCSRQRESGLFGMDDSRCVNRVAEGPCFILWPAVGLFRLWKLTKEERYYHCAEKAMTALEQHILPNGRCRTTYEVMHGEDWRPVSSETAMAFYAFGAAYEVTGSDHYRELTERNGAFLLQLPTARKRSHFELQRKLHGLCPPDQPGSGGSGLHPGLRSSGVQSGLPAYERSQMAPGGREAGRFSRFHPVQRRVSPLGRRLAGFL